MKEIKKALTDLQGRHSELTQSYETLQLEYSVASQQIEMLRRKYENESLLAKSSLSGTEMWDSPLAGPFDQLPVDFSASLYGRQEEGKQEWCGAKVWRGHGDGW
jgi:hypothetical protein